MSEKVKGLSDDCDEDDAVVTDRSKANTGTSQSTRKKTDKTDLMKISGGILSNINYKMAFLLFIIGIIIFSDVFIENIIQPFGDTVDAECTTTKGTMIQLSFLTIGYLILDLIVKYEVL
jgi:hypothetical protein